jgi:hypothetical protein
LINPSSIIVLNNQEATIYHILPENFWIKP